MGDASWQVVCASPANHAGKDLIHLKDSELTCSTHEFSTSGHYHSMIVDEGMQISIPCSNDSQDIKQVHWWTPHGQVKENQPKLLIKDITEQHAGLYVCVSGLQGEHISVFDLQVYKKGSGSRPRREAATILDEQENKKTQRNDPVVRQTVSQSNFALAVSLSVIITFIVAFIIGVLLRPLLEKLWRRIRSKRQATPPTTTTTTTFSTVPQPYVNEGYSDVEDQEQEVRVGSRVTFGGITEVEAQVPYYVTVENDQADGSSESNTEVEAVYETIDKNKSSVTSGKQQTLERETHRGRADSISSSSLQEGEVNGLVINGMAMEFEPIPDANGIIQLKRRGSSSTSSQSSQEGNLSREAEQSVDPPAVNISGNKNTMERIPGFSTDPFSERPTRLTELSVDELDPELWNDSGESFSFNEGSERSSIRDLSNSALGHPLKDDDKWRQSSVESPSDKINFDSEVGVFDKPFGKELLVDDVKQLKRSDTVSSSSSSESGESVGGPNKYVVNPEEMDESDTENYEKMPSAGILIRQEDVTHGDSIDDSMHIYDSPRKNEDVNISDKLGIFVDVGLDRVPKVKRYVEFKQFKPHSGPTTVPSFSLSSTKKNTSSDMITLPSSPSLTTKVAIQETRRYSSSSDDSELTTEDNFFRNIGVSSDGVSKVKRFITFKQFEPSSPSRPSITKKDKMLEAKSHSSSSDDDDGDQLTTKGDNFITFKQSEASSLSPPSITKKDEMLEAKSYSSSSDDDDSDQLTTKGDNFITFKQSETTFPSPPFITKKEEMLKAESYSSSSDDDDQLTNKGDNLDVSSDGISKVKRYISFTQIESSSPTLTTEETIKSVQPSTTPEDTSQNVKKYMYLKQHQQHSSSLPSSPTSNRKGLSGKKTKRKKQQDQDSMPLYHVHPVYRSSINRLNRGYDTDRSYSSEEEDEFSEYPIEFTMAPGINTGSITPNKKADKVLNIDFDNSSSSTDVFDKKHSKGLLRLRALSARLFNRHENETDEMNLQSQVQTKSPTGSGVSSNRKPKVTKVTRNEDSLFENGLSLDHLPSVKRYLQFSHSDSYPQVKLPSPPSGTGVVTPKFIGTTGSRRSSSSSEEDAQIRSPKPTTGVVAPGFIGTAGSRRSSSSSEEDAQIRSPKPTTGVVAPGFIGTAGSRRYSSSSEDDIQLQSPQPSTVVVTPKFIATTESRRSSSSSEDDFKETTEYTDFAGQVGASYDRLPKVKRYIQFSSTEPRLTTLPLNKELVAKPESRRSNTSSEDDIKLTTNKDNFFGKIGVSINTVPNVKRYIQFNQPKPYSPTLTSSPISTKRPTVSQPEATIDRSSGHLMQTEISPVSIQKVKRYIGFKLSEPHSPTLPSPPSLIIKDAIQETRRYSSSSSSSDDELTTKEDDFFMKIGVSSDGVSKVKRFITFKQLEPSSPTVPVSSPSTKIEAETSKLTSTSKDVRSQNENEEIGISLDRVPRVKRYIQFKQPVSHLPVVSPTTSDKLQVIPEVKTKSESRRSSSSSDDEPNQIKPTAQVDNVFGQTGTSLDRVPLVRRYIQFTHPEIQSPPQTTIGLTSERVNVTTVAKETKRWSTSSEEDVTPITKKENITEGTSEYLTKIPKIKRYIKFTQPEPYTSNLSAFRPSSTEKPKKVTETKLKQPTTRDSTSSEDDVQEGVGQIGVSLNKVPKVKRYIQFKHPESQSPALSTSTVSAQKLGALGVVEDKRRSSSSSEDDITVTAKKDNVFGDTGASLDKIPKVKRYIQFTKPTSEPLVQTTTALPAERLGIAGVVQGTRKSSSTSSSDDDDEVKPSTQTDDNVFTQKGESFDKIPKVKRYIKFTQSEPLPLPSTVTSVKVTETGSSTLVENYAQPSLKVNVKEENVVGQTEAHLDRIPRVKRYIQFTHPESQSPALSTSAVSAQKLGVLGVVQDTRRSSSSSEEDVTLTAKEDSLGGHIGAPLNKIPKVKRYIHFTHSESQSPAQTTTALTAERVNVSVVAKETRKSSSSSDDDDKPSANKTGESLDKYPKVKRYIEFRQYEPYASKFQSSSVVKPIKETTTELRGSIGNKTESMTQIASSESPDRVARVKRYIQFTPIESQYPSRASTAALDERVQETKISNTSAEYVKPTSTNVNIIGKTGRNFFQETGVSLDKIPKVKRYVAFTKSEPSSSTLTTQWSTLTSEVSPPASMKKGSALIIKTQSESWKSEFSSLEQTGQKSKLRKSSSSSSDESEGHEVEPPALPLTSPPPLEPENAREYLRENSEVRQRQERRRLLQQRRREMEEFDIASLSSLQQEGNKQDRSPAGFGGVTPFQTEHTYSNVSTSNTSTSRSTEGAEAPVLRGLKTKSTSTASSNSTSHKYREYLI
ncbi:uncharacterized protein lrrc66 [Garra rufa]|uniref:uncharacterized protein lrrc66 n=1 Tax=Garra rufa TaxID=137080 RepID=UPI003CCE869C